LLTVLPCYAAADAPAAADLAGFLGRGANADILLAEGEIRPPDDIVSKLARDGGMAEAVLLLFSPDSIPAKWDRRQWEGAFQAAGTRVAPVVIRECYVPQRLMPIGIFDLTSNRLAGFRAVKTWLLGHPRLETPPEAHNPELEALAVQLADQPGTAAVDTPETALAFVRRHAGEFEAIFRLECRERSTAALAGDLAEQFALQLPGPLEENLERLRRCCAERRCLYVLHGPDPAPDVLGPRASVLRILSAPPPGFESDLAAVRHSWQRALACDWTLARDLGRQAIRLAVAAGRYAEAFEIAETLEREAEPQADRKVLEDSAWERAWILERWGRTDEAEALHRRRQLLYSDQMALDFG
jgi:hypothetical protein